MNRIFIAALAGIAAGITTGSVQAAAADTMLPGWYEQRTTGLTARPVTAHSCIGAGHSLAQALHDQAGGDCRVTRSLVAGGRISVAATCPGGTTAMTGRYTNAGFDAAVTGTMQVAGKTLPLKLAITSRRVAATCPAGADD